MEIGLARLRALAVEQSQSLANVLIFEGLQSQIHVGRVKKLARSHCLKRRLSQPKGERAGNQ